MSIFCKEAATFSIEFRIIVYCFHFDSGLEDSPADNNTIINTCQSVLDSVVYNENVQTEGTTKIAVLIMLPVDGAKTEVVRSRMNYNGA